MIFIKKKKINSLISYKKLNILIFTNSKRYMFLTSRGKEVSERKCRVPDEVSERVAANLANNPSIIPIRMDNPSITENDRVLENLVSIRYNIQSIRAYSFSSRTVLFDVEALTRNLIIRELSHHSETIRLINENNVEVTTKLSKVTEDSLQIIKKLEDTNQKLDFLGSFAKKVVILGGVCVSVGLFYKYNITPTTQKNFDIVEFFENNKNNLKNISGDEKKSLRDKLIKVGLLKFIK